MNTFNEFDDNYYEFNKYEKNYLIEEFSAKAKAIRALSNIEMGAVAETAGKRFDKFIKDLGSNLNPKELNNLRQKFIAKATKMEINAEPAKKIYDNANAFAKAAAKRIRKNN